jgi:hypothetical protein
MKTSSNGPHKIRGCIPEGFDRGPRMTDKAVRVTVDYVEGEDCGRPDTEWLPRSICSDLQIFQDEEDGIKFWAFSATVPAWWIRKLDNRAAWQHAGMARPPMATRPW